MCGHVWMVGHVTLQPGNDPCGFLCATEWNSPEGRPVTDSHFTLPVRARKPLPCHNPSPCNLSASWVSAVAIETTVKGKTSSPTPEVIHKNTQLSLLNCRCRNALTDKIQKGCVEGSKKVICSQRERIISESKLWKKRQRLRCLCVFPKRLQSPSTVTNEHSLAYL